MNKAREQILENMILEAGFRGMDLNRILSIARRYKITEQLMDQLTQTNGMTKTGVWETMNELIA